jgi:hypothetical protein
MSVMTCTDLSINEDTAVSEHLFRFQDRNLAAKATGEQRIFFSQCLYT